MASSPISPASSMPPRRFDSGTAVCTTRCASPWRSLSPSAAGADHDGDPRISAVDPDLVAATRRRAAARPAHTRCVPQVRGQSAPSASKSVLCVKSADLGEIRIPLDELRSSALTESSVSDFHCVTTWTARRQTWTGVPLAAWWTTRIGPFPSEPFAVVRAADGYQAVFRTDDLFTDDVVLAWALNGGALGQRHGAPLGLVSPSQYGDDAIRP